MSAGMDFRSFGQKETQNVSVSKRCIVSSVSRLPSPECSEFKIHGQEKKK